MPLWPCVLLTETGAICPQARLKVCRLVTEGCGSVPLAIVEQPCFKELLALTGIKCPTRKTVSADITTQYKLERSKFRDVVDQAKVSVRASAVMGLGWYSS